MQESSKGRRLTASERQELLSNPVKLVQTLLGPLGVLYSGLKPAAIETVASQAVSAQCSSSLKMAGIQVTCDDQHGSSTVASATQ
jgi:hypothetical protein